MRLNCAFRDSSTMKGKFEAPEKCKEVNCIGMFKIRPRQEKQFKKTFPCFLPDVESIMKMKM